MNKSKLHSEVARLPAYKALTARARSVWQSLWSFAGGAEADETGQLRLSCRVRIDTIADAEGSCRRTVLMALAELERAGFLERARTGRATEFGLIPAPREVQSAAPQMRNPLHIRCAVRCTSDAQSAAHREPPSICIHQDLLTKTSSPRSGDGGEHRPSGARQPDLDGAAAVAFEMLTERACPAAVRFESPGDRSVLRRLLVGLAEARSPVVELTRYAIDRAREPGLRSPRGMVIATLREPDFHAVYEHAERLRATEAARERSGERRAREAADAVLAAHAAAQADQAATDAVASATPAQLADAVAAVLAGADKFLARRLRGLTTEQLLARTHTRGLIIGALGQSHHAGSTPAQQ